MATFTNQATLSYNGTVVSSNVVTGQLQEALTAVKTAVDPSYSVGDTVTYVISIVNSSTVAYTALTVTDNLGAYTFEGQSLQPMDYVEGSVAYYQNGVVQAAPTVSTADGLTVSGISVPAGGSAQVIYQARVNSYAPPASGGSITNEAVISGAALAAPISVTETVTVTEAAQLSITKSLTPVVVTADGQLTYTFVIQNMGNTAAVVTDNIVLADSFDPILSGIAVSYNGVSWSAPENYSYNEATGEFATVAGQITVPAAEYVQDATTGVWTVSPGVSTLQITGTV